MYVPLNYLAAINLYNILPKCSSKKVESVEDKSGKDVLDIERTFRNHKLPEILDKDCAPKKGYRTKHGFF